MKRIFLLLFVLCFSITSSQAGILRNIFGYGQNYNNGYYYNPNIRYTNGSYYQPQSYYRNNYYDRNYYNPYPQNYYNQIPYGNFYQQPVIYRSNVIRKKSMVDNNEKLVTNIKLSEIDKLEKQILLQTYDYDSDKTRIERLEQRIFGANQSGNLEERLLCLKNAVKNYKAYNPNMYNKQYKTPIFTGSSGNSWKNNVWSNFKNQFIGMPTGFTPAMDPAYMDYFEAERAMAGNGEEIDIQTNQGYYKSKKNRGARTGVTILD